ncbi:MAG: HAMP domain-containing histidine kinase [Candidatus Riflebacteria bacterium]|nr:HAMP domain-containing histidine kinase [Candidatus Riflebacteria bacterium]
MPEQNDEKNSAIATAGVIGKFDRFAVSALIFVLVIASGILALLMSRWNRDQLAVLLQWAAEKEGRALYTRVIHEGGLSPMLLMQQPELFSDSMLEESDILAAGIMQGGRMIASFSRQPDLRVDLSLLPPDREAVILDDNTALYRRLSGPGRNAVSSTGLQTGRRHGGGPGSGGGRGLGPGRQRFEAESGAPVADSERLSIYLVFYGPDRTIVQPLILQMYLWPGVWLVFSLLWLVISLMQSRTARLKVMLQKESHLSDIGRMSARLAHEIKNPLGAIRGMAQLLQKKCRDGHEPEKVEMATTIEQETFRLEELTRSILDFARPQECRVLPLNLTAVVEDTLRIFNQQLSEGSIVAPSDQTVPECLGDDNAIRQILLNLLKNALDAAENSAAVRLEITVDSETVILRVYNPAGYMSEQMLEDVFTPFVSTKVKGYGLGLPVSRRLAEQMGGSLRLVNAAPGEIMAELKLRKAE